MGHPNGYPMGSNCSMWCNQLHLLLVVVVQYICMYLYISALYIEYVCMYCSICYVAMVLYSSVQQRTSSIVVQQYMIILKGNQIMKIRHILVVVVAVAAFFSAVNFVGKQLDKEFSCVHTSKGVVCDK